MASMEVQGNEGGERLDRLFRAYGEAAVEPDATANFSANMWEAIESRRNSRLFGLVAKLVTSGALAASLLLGVLSSTKAPQLEPEYLTAYIEQPAAPPAQGELLSSILEAEDQK